MVQSALPKEELKNKKIKKLSKFDNVFIDAIYNIIAWLPVTIISYIISTLDL